MRQRRVFGLWSLDACYLERGLLSRHLWAGGLQSAAAGWLVDKCPCPWPSVDKCPQRAASCWCPHSCLPPAYHLAPASTSTLVCLTSRRILGANPPEGSLCRCKPACRHRRADGRQLGLLQTLYLCLFAFYLHSICIPSSFYKTCIFGCYFYRAANMGCRVCRARKVSQPVSLFLLSVGWPACKNTR